MDFRTEKPNFQVKTSNKTEIKTFADHILDCGVLDKKNFGQEFEVAANFKTVLAQGTSNPNGPAGPGLTSYERPDGIVLLNVQKPRIADLIPQFPTDKSSLRLFVETALPLDAGMVGENGVKPEGEFDLAEQDFPSRKIAVLQPVTDEMLADHPVVAGYLNQRMPYKIEMKEDYQLLNGDGNSAANNVLGFLHTPGIQTYVKNAEVPNGGTESNSDAIRHAKALVQSVGFAEPNGMVCHPLDWEILCKEKDNNKQYYGGGPFTGSYGVGGIASNVARYWDMAVITTTNIAQGTILVGDFADGCEIYRRQGITIDVSNSHNDTFARNVKTFRAEERIIFAVTKPKNFVEITGIGS